MTITLGILAADVAALKDAVAAVAPDLAAVPQLKADLAKAQTELLIAQTTINEATAQSLTDQKKIDELAQQIADLTAQLRPATAG